MTPQQTPDSAALDERIRKAVEADFQQWMIDSLTPDRGYLTPIDNVRSLILERQRMAADIRIKSALSALLADLVERWRLAEKHWRKRASAIDRDYKGKPIYEDGLAEAFGRCADILVNTMAGAANVEVSGAGPLTQPETEAAPPRPLH